MLKALRCLSLAGAASISEIGRVQCVGHIHHIHIRAGLHRTYEFFSLHGRVENIHRIVRSAATRRGHVEMIPGKRTERVSTPYFV